MQLDEISGTSKFLKLRESRIKISNEFDNDFYSSIDSNRDQASKMPSQMITPPIDSTKNALSKSHLINANRLSEIAIKNELELEGTDPLFYIEHAQKVDSAYMSAINEKKEILDKINK
jgi:hypothetical protein